MACLPGCLLNQASAVASGKIAPWMVWLALPSLLDKPGMRVLQAPTPSVHVITQITQQLISKRRWQLLESLQSPGPR
jgi:hypothetical protein